MQIKEAEAKKQLKYEEYLKDKEMVDEIVNKIMEEERKKRILSKEQTVSEKLQW